MTGVTALVLAGSRQGARDPMALAAGVSHKALLPVGGVPMLARVLAALRASPGIARIVVMIEAPERSLAGFPLGNALPRPAEGSPSRSVAAALAEFGAPLLVTTADHALLTPAMVGRFLADLPPGVDVAAGLARAETVLAAWPETRRTWLRFRDGRFSGCNLFWMGTARAGAVVDFWRQVEQQRKKPLSMVRLLGPWVLLRFALGLLSLPAVLAALGARTGTRLAAVELPFAEAAVDVDKPADLELAEAVLARRG
ncbi:nucleotidyltransferase family protein [Roseomonas marmotae]|uniref:Nucleotidyltransferase family protein n=1 Tax=Roseomonas marmotae TaxID=2768161 RepID=A0ABS3KG30_9PROT|nr:nucleotidyltransferase family protein [Roseomonas marmotae]MBO1075875.1 nucleotidyltransferase family protein [Roseomonas marmotae]QTI81937.1 nucleotidyltransferase family protein [Roseomonas marmotae]